MNEFIFRLNIYTKVIMVVNQGLKGRLKKEVNKDLRRTETTTLSTIELIIVLTMLTIPLRVMVEMTGLTNGRSWPWLGIQLQLSFSVVSNGDDSCLVIGYWTLTIGWLDIRLSDKYHSNWWRDKKLLIITDTHVANNRKTSLKQSPTGLTISTSY